GGLIIGSATTSDTTMRFVDRLPANPPVSGFVGPGCGTAATLCHLYTPPSIRRLVGGDISPTAVALGSKITQRLEIPATFSHFDFGDRASLGRLTEGVEDYLLLTCHAIEQLPVTQTELVVEDMLDLPNPPRVVVHFEPMISEEDDSLM